MIKILTPISHLFSEKNNSAERIAACSDFLEARERTSHLRLEKTSHYHIDFDLNIGITEDQKNFLRSNVKDRDEISTLTFQAARDCEVVELKNGMYVPKSPPLSLEEQIRITKKSVLEIIDIVGSDRQIGIENNNYYPTGAYDISTSVNFLLEVLSIDGMHLLLDIAHAKVSAYNLDIDLFDYIMPLLQTQLCKQVHICEPAIVTNESGLSIMIDKHEIPSMPLTLDVLSLMNRFNINYLTCEYYKDPDVLISYLNQVCQRSAVFDNW